MHQSRLFSPHSTLMQQHQLIISLSFVSEKIILYSHVIWGWGLVLWYPHNINNYEDTREPFPFPTPYLIPLSKASDALMTPLVLDGRW